MRRVVTGAVVVGLGLCASAGTATASSLGVETVSDLGGTRSYVTFAGSDGANHVTITDSGSTIAFEDADETISARDGSSCTTSGDGHRAECPIEGDISPNLRGPAAVQISVALAGGDDAATVSSTRRVYLNGGAGNDQLTAGSGDDWLNGGPGADVLNGGAGEDNLERYPGTDGVNVTLDGVADDGAAGEGDNVGADIENFSGGDGNDVLAGSDANNVITGAGGDDRIDGGAGNDMLYGQGGSDSVSGGDGDDTVSGAFQRYDTPSSPDGADTLSGGAGADTLTGADGDDSADGGPGDDTIMGGPGADTLAGGAGDDTISGDDGTLIRSVVALLHRLNYFGPGAFAAFAGADAAQSGGSSSPVGGQPTGVPGADTIDGGDGSDVLAGGPAGDRVEGGAGDDIVFDNSQTGSIGQAPDQADPGDVLNGGDGQDLVDYSARAGGVTVDENALPDDGAAGEHDNVQGFEQVHGSRGNDVIVTGSTDDVVWAEGGDDQISTGAGNDYVLGDTVVRGRDTIDTGDGDDELDGFGSPLSNLDSLTCGAGADRVHVRDAVVSGDCEQMVDDIRCPQTVGDCQAALVWEVPASVAAATASKRRPPVVVARGSARLASGNSTSLRPKLTRAGKRLLKARRRAHKTVKLTRVLVITAHGKRTTTRGAFAIKPSRRTAGT